MRPELGAHVNHLHIGCMEGYLEGVADSAELNEDLNNDQVEELFAAFPDASQEDMLILVAAATANGFANSVILRGGCAGQIILLLDYLPNIISLTSYGAPQLLKLVGYAAAGRLAPGLPAGFNSLRAFMMNPKKDILILACFPFWHFQLLINL